MSIYEMKEMINTIKEKAAKLEIPSDVWKLENYLSEHREEVGQKVKLS